MKIIFLLILIHLPILAFCQNKDVQKPLSNAKIEFSEKQFDFGDIIKGESITHKFKFTNTGTEPLIILNVQTTCGCTAPQWPKSPIPPGEAGEIQVFFNSSKKIGRQNKIITVYTNGQKPEEKLKIVGNILPETNSTPENKNKVDQE